MNYEVEKNHLSITARHDDNESGMSNRTEHIFQYWLPLDKDLILKMANELFDENFNGRGTDINLLESILHALSHFDYEDLSPVAAEIAAKAILHSDPGVLDYSLKCFENWNKSEFIKVIEPVNFGADWLQDYANSIIQDLINIQENSLIQSDLTPNQIG